MMDNNYLWPTPKGQPQNIIIKNDLYSLEKKIIEIEIFFESLFKYKVILFPSGRSSLSAIFKTLKINRGNIIFAPKWSSQCVWSVIGQYGTPTTNFFTKPDVILNVNKWGYSFKMKNLHSSFLIQDSVDSLILNTTDLFKFNAEFEIISLPKTIGSYFGGLIIIKDTKYYDKLKKLQCQTIELGEYQSNLKLSGFFKKNDLSFEKWEHLENNNFSIDLTAATNIAKCLDNWNKNVQTIKRRLEFFQNKKFVFKSKPNLSSRLPAHLLISGDTNNQKVNGLLKLHFNLTQETDNEVFKPVYLVPLHFGISDKDFKKIANILEVEYDYFL